MAVSLSQFQAHELSLGSGGEATKISVRNHGSGAPEYALLQLLEHAYCSDHRPARKTGLRLAFVREVARLHRDNADFANHLESGGLAWFKLRKG